MTVAQIISKCDELFPNALLFSVKAQWLKELDSRIYSEFLMKFTDNEREYADYEYSSSTQLLLPDSFSEVYLRYLVMQQDIMNSDTARYQNSQLLFNAAYLSFMNFYNRTHKIKEATIKAD